MIVTYPCSSPELVGMEWKQASENLALFYEDWCAPLQD